MKKKSKLQKNKTDGYSRFKQKRAFTRKAFYFKTEINRMNHEKEKIV